MVCEWLYVEEGAVVGKAGWRDGACNRCRMRPGWEAASGFCPFRQERRGRAAASCTSPACTAGVAWRGPYCSHIAPVHAAVAALHAAIAPLHATLAHLHAAIARFHAAIISLPCSNCSSPWSNCTSPLQQLQLCMQPLQLCLAAFAPLFAANPALGAQPVLGAEHWDALSPFVP